MKQTSNFWGDFSWSPYDVIPVEYLALVTVRKKLGLDTPKPKHPLLDTPFAEMPEHIEPVKDEFLDKVLAEIRKTRPNL